MYFLVYAAVLSVETLCVILTISLTGEDKWEESEPEYMNDHIVVSPLEPGTKYEVKVVAGNGDTDDLKAESYPEEVTTEGDGKHCYVHNNMFK